MSLLTRCAEIQETHEESSPNNRKLWKPRDTQRMGSKCYDEAAEVERKKIGIKTVSQQQETEVRKDAASSCQRKPGGIYKHELESSFPIKIESCSICLEVVSECGQQPTLRIISSESGNFSQFHLGTPHQS